MAADLWETYFYPGTETLVNTPGLRDAKELQKFERAVTSARFIELRINPVPPTFDVAHFKAIHRRLFQNVYPWAGEFRSVEMQKDDVDFAPLRSVEHPSLESWGHAVLKQLEADRHLKDLTKEAFITKLAGHFREINYWHPFREGNGRTTRLFLMQLAEGAGYSLDFSRTNAPRWNHAARIAEEANESVPLRTVFRAVATPLRALAFAEALHKQDASIALRRHPELQSAFETLTWTRSLSQTAHSEQKTQAVYQRIAAHLQRRLEAGYPPARPSRESVQQLIDSHRSLSR